MNFILAAGGTGGHMVPAHALAAELKARGHGVMLVTDDRGAKYPGLFKDVPVHILPAGRLGGGPLGLLKAMRSVLRGRRQARAHAGRSDGAGPGARAEGRARDVRRAGAQAVRSRDLRGDPA